MSNVNIEFDSVKQALEEYAAYFGEDYFFYMGFAKTDADIIQEIQRCIRQGKKQSSPRYKEDLIY